MNVGESKKMRIFILTDGQVSDLKAVKSAALEHSEKIRVFTFGLGSGCDKNLVMGTAQAGRGTCSIVKDGGQELNGLVIRALQNAMELSLKNCSATWGSRNPHQLSEVFRNQSVLLTKIMPVAEFEQLVFKFRSEEDPLTKAPIDLTFSSFDFAEVTGESAEGLFKQAALDLINELGNDQPAMVATSLKYQTLCDHTAMVGVMKQQDKATGELKEVSIEFGRKAQQTKIPQPRLGGPRSMLLGSARGGRMAVGRPRGQASNGMGGGAEMLQMRSKCAAAPQQKMMKRAAAAPMMRSMMPEESQRLGSSQSVATFASTSSSTLQRSVESKEVARPKMAAKAMMPQTKSVAKLGMAESESVDDMMDIGDMLQQSAMTSLKTKEKKKESLPRAAIAEESKTSTLKRSASPKSGSTAPTFESVIASQCTEGYWPQSTKDSLAAFFMNSVVEDPDVKEAVSNLGSADAEQIYATLLAIFVLMEMFSHKEDEWTLLVRKAKAYLKAAGLDKPDKVIKKFNLELKN